MSFVHLHNHSDFSVLDGLVSVDELADAAVRDGQTAIALTDHGTLAGAFAFQQACQRAGVKPIIGMEAYVALSDRHHPTQVGQNHIGEDGTTSKSNFHLTLLAKNRVGWHNLVLIHNESWETFYKKPLTDFEHLAEHSEGLICLTGCLGGPVAGPLAAGYPETAKKNLQHLIDIFGAENVFVELMNHGIDAEAENPRALTHLAREFGLDVIVTNDCHYHLPEDAYAHEAQLANNTSAVLSDPGRYAFEGTGYHVRTEDEMREVMSATSWQRGCDNTQAVADMCEYQVIPPPSPRLPQFPLPDGVDSAAEYLHQQVLSHAKHMYGQRLPAEVRARLREEEDVIVPAGFADYFLIAWDMITWCHQQDILTGPGRGSAAGSLTAYVLGLTQVDPLRHGLLFERFLEPGRPDFPDIDFDIEKSRRDEVISYLATRYGADKVGRIGAYGIFRSKAAIKGVGRVLELGSLANALSTEVPVEQGKPLPLSLINDQGPATERFWEVMSSGGEQADNILDLARTWEGRVNTRTVHACGVMIADEPLNNVVPTWRQTGKGANSTMPVSSWDMNDVADYGLLKLDLLGLETLDVIARTAQIIRESTGEPFDLVQLPGAEEDTPQTRAMWDLLRRGDTDGIFQLESDGMKNIIRDVKPSNLEDLSAVLALFRPGPLSSGLVGSFIQRKAGNEKVDYAAFSRNPREQTAIAEVLDTTYGVFVYQEQVMKLGQVIAGFDAAARNKLRKAVGKKNPRIMAEVGDMLIAGAGAEVVGDDGAVISPVFSEATAARVFELMKGSADYLFNKSHSMAYAHLAATTALLKANWPAQFGAALLSVSDKDSKRLSMLDSLASDGIQVHSPDVNHSQASTSSDGQQVWLGLQEVKGVGRSGLSVVRARGDKPFTDRLDVSRRVKGLNESDEKLPKDKIEALIEAGAYDAFGTRRALYRVAKTERNDLPTDTSEWGPLDRAGRETKRLGVHTGAHPLAAVEEDVNEWSLPDPTREVRDQWANQHPSEQKILAKAKPGLRPQIIDHMAPGDYQVRFVYGVLARWDQYTNHHGTRAHFVLEGEQSRVDGVVWPSALSSLHHQGQVPEVGSVVAVLGTLRTRTVESETTDEAGEVHLQSDSFTSLSAASMWVIPTTGFDVIEEDTQAPETSFGDLVIRARTIADTPTNPTPGTRKTQKTDPARPAVDADTDPDTNVIDLSGRLADKARTKVLDELSEIGVPGELGEYAVFALIAGSAYPTVVVPGKHPYWTGFRENFPSYRTVATGCAPGLYRSAPDDAAEGEFCWFVVTATATIPDSTAIAGMVKSHPSLQRLTSTRTVKGVNVYAATG